MQIIINTTPGSIQDYAAFVYTGITEGQTSGHYDAENNWTMIPDSQTAAITAQITAYLDLSNSDNLPEADVAAWQAIDSLLPRTGHPHAAWRAER
jgi:hypothetical protein